MQFGTPTILYALFALLIPIIVHLFQLRRFQKTAFTNVKFLKELEVQTRKSSQLKKWLTLLTRLLVFSCIIFAFAQPFIPNSEQATQKKETVVYIDNSLSMQAKGNKGTLLHTNIQDFIETFSSTENITVLTNNNTYKNTNLEVLKKELLTIKYSPQQLSYQTLSFKADQLFSKNKNTHKRFIAISDFQNNKLLNPDTFNTNIQNTLIQTLPVKKENISIDTAYIETKLNNNSLIVNLKNQNSSLNTIPVSLFQNDSLISKVSAELDKNNNQLTFPLPNKNNLNLKLLINKDDLLFDNELFLTKIQPKKLNALTIGKSSSNAFLQKIFSKDEFVLTENDPSKIQYANFSNQNIIVLNELENLSAALIQNIQTFEKNGGTVLIIPNENSNLANYKFLLPNYGSLNKNKTRLTELNYSHPILKDVFEKKVNNFQYPTIQKHYQLKNYETLILGLENQSPLLVQYKNYYLFAAALNKDNSNIKQSPIIVPTIYNIAKSSLKLGKPYQLIAQENTIEIPFKLQKDEVVHITSDESNFIPLQEIKGNKVQIHTFQQPSKAGIYSINQGEKKLSSLAYNHNRLESNMNYYTIENLRSDHITTGTSVTKSIDQINSMNEVVSLWKWFIIFALIFLGIELLILKYL
ncbi:BatA domain-containing protein [Pseudofulvibacter geojedonensis]|uniref:BatA domain-containing protein n=1 Tax=Pseudofulvibacter geojedonensis TaxID=1123758 RepID=A0ABW3HYR9_9FLAO